MSESVSRRTVLSRLTGLLGGAWLLATGGLTAAFVTTPLRESGGAQELLLGNTSVFGEDFKKISL